MDHKTSNGSSNGTDVDGAQEAKGGIKYELVLEKPSSETPPPKVAQSLSQLQSPARVISVEDIENKLKSAEERRRSIEASKITQAKEHLEHVVEIQSKRNEFEKIHSQETRESLEKKMETFKENRENNLKAIMDKQKEHIAIIEAKRKLAEKEALASNEEKLEAIELKLSMAAQSRQDRIIALQQKLGEYDKRVIDVKKQMDNVSHDSDLSKNVGEELSNLSMNRDEVLIEIIEKQKEFIDENERKLAEANKRKSVSNPSGGDSVGQETN